jgi:hypothetical protein
VEGHNWRDDFAVFSRQRTSLLFLLAGMILLATFWTDRWAWVIFFVGVALYSAWLRAPLGVLAGSCFALWFMARDQGWTQYNDSIDFALGLLCIASLFLLVVWGADARQLKAAAHGDDG